MTDSTGGGGGALDMGRFHQVFFEEAAEHLTNLERLLVGIDVDAPAADDLNAIFRAAHSVKGGSGTFGFTEMMEVTHVLESLLDRVRKSELALTAAMVDVALASNDLLRELLAHYRGEAEPPNTSIESMCAQIRACMDAGSAPGASSAVPGVKAAASGARTDAAGQDAAGQDAAASVPRLLEISFALPRDRHSDVEGLLGELRQLGPVESLPATEAGRMQLRLTTAASDADVLAPFEFLVDPDTVTIAAVTDQDLNEERQGYGFFADAPGTPEPPAEDPGYGFFSDAPGTPTSAGAGSEHATPAEDLGYGFFADAPGTPSTSLPTTAEGSGPADGGAASGGRGSTGGGGGAAASGRAVASPQRPAATKTTPSRAEAADSSIRVSVGKVDDLINLVGELVITQAMLAQTASTVDPVIYERLLGGLAQLDRNTRDLQTAVMSVRMMPIAEVFNRFPRVVRDLASKLGKLVDLKMEGEGTELDKGIIEKLADPLTHLIRNSLDHGLEPTEERLAAGKSARGTILLRAFHRAGNIVIEVSDDGAGLDRDRILKKAKERGMAVTDTMPDDEVWPLIFEPGFSTAAVVTDVSGRGVGMDVVRRNIGGLGGRIDISSTKGVGLRVSIRLPLTLAILDGMSVGVSGETFIIPLNHVVESLQVGASDVKTVSGDGRVITVRGEYVPVVALQKVFSLAPPDHEGGDGVMVILEADGATIALLVDELLGQRQVVIKSLEKNYRKVSGISGATIMGDGRVAMIIDVPALTQIARR